MTIWSDEVLEMFAEDAEAAIVQDTSCLYHRFMLTITAGTSVYTLPDKVRSIERITWRGRKVFPMNWEDLQTITPGTVVVSPSTRIETSESRPMWYALHPTNVHYIRFYPTPDESFTNTGDPFSPDTEAKCIISCMRNVDTSDSTASLPSYIDRRTRKSFILWKAFEKEGNGQNLKGAQFYMGKYKFLIEQFKKINQGTFISKRYSLDDGSLSDISSKYPRPTLGPNFERVRY